LPPKLASASREGRSPEAGADDVWISVASSIVPRFSMTPALSSCRSSSANSFSISPRPTSSLRKRFNTV
jgi:hypothetical protein